MPQAIRGSRFVRRLLAFAALGLAPALGASAYDQAYESRFWDNVDFRCFDSAGGCASSFAVLYIKPIALP